MTKPEGPVIGIYRMKPEDMASRAILLGDVVTLDQNGLVRVCGPDDSPYGIVTSTANGIAIVSTRYANHPGGTVCTSHPMAPVKSVEKGKARSEAARKVFGG